MLHMAAVAHFPLLGSLLYVVVFGSLVAFKDLTASATKFTQRGANASADYTKNAGNAGATWATNAAAAGASWQAGVQDAITRDAFHKGVSKAGAAKYTAQIAAVAGPRYADGIGKAGPAWQKGFGAIAAAVSGKDIGPRGARGSQANKTRASNMSDAFRAAKLAALG